MLINKNLLQLTTKKDQELLLEVCRLISISYDYAQTLPRGKVPTYRCHTICRALAIHVPELKVCDGIYVGAELTKEKRPTDLQARQARHSWLVTPDDAIIDPYPVGVIACGSPLLMPARGRYAPFGKGLYITDEAVASLVMTSKRKQETKILTGLLEKAKKQA